MRNNDLQTQLNNLASWVVKTFPLPPGETFSKVQQDMFQAIHEAREAGKSGDSAKVTQLLSGLGKLVKKQKKHKMLEYSAAMHAAKIAATAPEPLPGTGLAPGRQETRPGPFPPPPGKAPGSLT